MKFNRHHLNFPRTIHEAQPQLAMIRGHNGLIVPLDLDTHEALHRTIAVVPAMSHYMAQRAFRGFIDYGYDDNYINNIGNLQKGIEEAMRHPRASEIERALGSLTIQALDEQKPFVKYGLVTKYGKRAT